MNICTSPLLTLCPLTLWRGSCRRTSFLLVFRSLWRSPAGAAAWAKRLVRRAYSGCRQSCLKCRGRARTPWAHARHGSTTTQSPVRSGGMILSSSLPPIDSAATLSLLILSSHFLLSQDVCQIVRATRMAKHSQVCWPALSPTVRPWISSSAAVNAEKKYLVITPFSTRMPPRPHGEASM